MCYAVYTVVTVHQRHYHGLLVTVVVCKMADLHERVAMSSLARRNCETYSSGFVIMRFDAGADFEAGAQSLWIL